MLLKCLPLAIMARNARDAPQLALRCVRAFSSFPFTFFNATNIYKIYIIPATVAASSKPSKRKHRFQS